MSDAVGNVTHDLILPLNCTTADEIGCNDRPGRTQSPHAAQVRSTSLLPQHRSLSFHFTPRHIEISQFSLKLHVHIANTTVCIRKVTFPRPTVNVCIQQTVPWRMIQSLLHDVSFLELQEITNILNRFLFSFTILRRNRKYIFAPSKNTLTVWTILTGIRSHGNILLLYVETSACNAGASYMDPVRTIVYKPMDSDQFNYMINNSKKRRFLWSTKYYPGDCSL
jgi:hypothetical protein